MKFPGTYSYCFLMSMFFYLLCPNKLFSQKILNVVSIQPNLTRETLSAAQLADTDAKNVFFYNLNSKVGRWYVLTIQWKSRKSASHYHLEVTGPIPLFPLTAVSKDGPSIGIRGHNLNRDLVCSLWKEEKTSDLVKSESDPMANYPICEGRIHVRRTMRGQHSNKENVVDFLRKYTPGGEAITNLVKETVFQDQQRISVEAIPAPQLDSPDQTPKITTPVSIEKHLLKPVTIEPKDLGIDIQLEDNQQLVPGRWYAHKSLDGIYTSAVQLNLFDAKKLVPHEPDFKRFQNIDPVERSALIYLVAFDLSNYGIGFEVGTDHPSVEWSKRALENMIDKKTPGPDGIGNIEPLGRTGVVPPDFYSRVVATFTSGFKRDHSAFRWGPLSRTNKGSHYGFMQSGVMMSSLQADLATILMYNDGHVEMKSWQKSDRLEGVLHARQNGVAISEWDNQKNQPIFSIYSDNWSNGNWSGSQDGRQRSLRSGVCLQKLQDRDYLIYGFFSTATPLAMAAVFAGIKCQYAFHLDMNALEHTYLAIYPSLKPQPSVQHLHRGMSVLDRSVDKKTIPRFLGIPDNRDFFYVYKK